MHKFEEKLREIVQGVSLSKSEKLCLRETLVEYVAFRPLYQKQKSKTPREFSMQTFSVKYTAAVLVVAFVFLGGSVSFAAENAIPGDLLYPIKVSVNEELRDTLTFSDKAKASWQARWALRRLEEVERLAAEGKLTDMVRGELAERFERHATDAEALISALDNVHDFGREELLARIEAKLTAHEELLEEIAQARGEESIFEGITEKIRNRASQFRALAERNTLLTKDGGTIAASGDLESVKTSALQVISEELPEKREVPIDSIDDSGVVARVAQMQKAAETTLAKVEELRDGAYAKLDGMLLRRIDGFLEDARERYVAAEQLSGKEEYEIAFRLFREAFQLAHKAEVFATSKAQFIPLQQISPPLFEGTNKLPQREETPTTSLPVIEVEHSFRRGVHL